MARRRRYRDGIPIEEAPFWVLLLFAAILWSIAWPSLAGLLAGCGAWHGQRTLTALAALGVASLVTVGVATRRPWRRATARDLHDPRPLAVRFSTWLFTALLLPNLLFGILVLTHAGPPLGYDSAVALGLMVSAIHGVFAVVDRWRGRRDRSV